MKHLFKTLTFTAIILLSSSCSDDDDSGNPAPSNNNNTTSPSVTASDFSVTIDENPANGMSLGFIQASAAGGETVNYSFFSGSPFWLNVNLTTGELTVADSSKFDFEQNTSLTTTIVAFISDQSDIFDTAKVEITLNDVDESPAQTVQQRLTGGETPLQIYQSDNALLDSLYGKSYEGGLIFYFNTADGTGLVAAETDQSMGMAWDTTTNFVNQIATGATSEAIGDGASNTSTIVSALSALGMYAAKTCDELSLNSKTDWFLPTKNEMDEMYSNLHERGMGSFSNERYWSSTEFDLSPRGTAIYRDFDTSTIQSGGTTPKNANNYVRAARSF